MKTISKKKARHLSVLANRAGKLATLHEEASQAFWAAFKETIGSSGEPFNLETGAEDPLVDIVDYGRAEATIESMQKMVADILADDSSLPQEDNEEEAGDPDYP
jgi:hypothetical protein